MQLRFLGHAGVEIHHERARVVMDAWFSNEGAFDASWFQLPCNHHLAEADWSQVSAAIVSHEHLDHVDGAFLRGLGSRVPLFVPRYPSPALVRQLHRASGRLATILDADVDHEHRGVRFRLWTEASPMNHDSVWAFVAGGRSFVHTVDSRLSSEQLHEVLEYCGGHVDALCVQCAGASWFPLSYENYDPARKRAMSLKKREHKLAYAKQVADTLRPRWLVINAGPPAFLDPALRTANDDPSFPDPAQAKAWLREAGYEREIITPLPGDRLDLVAQQLRPDPSAHQQFCWDRRHAYIEAYAERMAPTIAAVYARADSLAAEDFPAQVDAHFGAMVRRNRYFLERIDMDVLFDIEGPDGGQWLVRMRPDDPGVGRWDGQQAYQYRYRFHSRWLKRIVLGGLHWEDFLLSVRFTAYRDPDVYNDHLLGLLKLGHVRALEAVEHYETGRADETIRVTAGDGTRYEIAKYCPHAGASLEHAPIEGHRLTCLLHHYEFDLRTGECLSGNCRLRSRRLAQDED
ncbi:MAG: Rieske 2Fe-2S domain-containing protein [Myxococcota bacterium]